MLNQFLGLTRPSLRRYLTNSNQAPACELAASLGRAEAVCMAKR
jgi:hypothetical protein